MTSSSPQLQEEVDSLKGELRTRDLALRSAQELKSHQEKIHSQQLLQVIMGGDSCHNSTM